MRLVAIDEQRPQAGLDFEHEVDFVRFKATGATIVVDAGGLVDPTGETEPTSLADWDCPNPTDGNGDGFADDCPLGRGVLNPQPQFCTAEDIALGTLADARTSIEELHEWQFNGPFLRDFAGRKPADGKRDAGALELAGD